MVSDYLRRIYNKVARRLDRQALLQEKRFLHEVGDPGSFKSASRAFSLVFPFVREIDSSAKLKMMVAPEGTDGVGAAFRWEFFFDLPRRRAQVEAKWFLRWDETLDGFGAARIEIIARPFPPMNSVFRTMVENGQLLYPQLRGLWQQERRRVVDLPHSFRDSDIALAELVRQGLKPSDAEFSLGTGTGPEGRPAWIAQTRTQSFYTELL